MLHNSTKELALCGVFCALGTSFLYFGSILPLTPYICFVFAVAIMVIVRLECRSGYAWLCWLATSLLGLILTAEKETVFLYCFMGYYPLLKPYLDSHFHRLGCWLIKGGFFLLSVSAAYCLLLFVFVSDAFLMEFTDTALWMHILLILLGIVLFFSCDVLITRLERLYQKRRHQK